MKKIYQILIVIGICIVSSILISKVDAHNMADMDMSGPTESQVHGSEMAGMPSEDSGMDMGMNNDMAHVMTMTPASSVNPVAPMINNEMINADQSLNISTHFHNTNMGDDMLVSSLTPLQSEDEDRANKILNEYRAELARYVDYHTALADGYTYNDNGKKKPLSEIYHFSKKGEYSLLYQKDETDNFHLVGIMITAGKDLTPNQLNSERYPTSLSIWHKHLNICITPNSNGNEHRFHAAESECLAQGGTWKDQGVWMTHLYLYPTVLPIDMEMGNMNMDMMGM